MNLDDVRKVLSRPGKPPVTKNEYRESECCEVREASPVGREAVEQDASIVPDKRGEWIEVDDSTVTIRYQRFRINDRSEIHPGRQNERDTLGNVAHKHTQRSEEPGSAERRN